jgi:hypothetical protein
MPGREKIRVMRGLRAVTFHSNLPAIGAMLALISVPAVGLDSGLALVGTISDQFQTPVPRAVATLTSNDRVLQTQASPAGQFRFDNVLRGAYDLEISAPGFARQTLSVDLSGAEVPPQAIVLQVASQPDIEKCGPQRLITYSPSDAAMPQLAGIIRSYEQGKPLPRAEVAMTRGDDPQITSHTLSDNHRGFRFDSLAAGRYNLRISRHGYLPAESKPLLVPRENNVTVDVTRARAPFPKSIYKDC